MVVIFIDDDLFLDELKLVGLRGVSDCGLYIQFLCSPYLTLHVWGGSFSVLSILPIFFLCFSPFIFFFFPGSEGLVQIPPKVTCCAFGSSRAVRSFFCLNLWCFSEWSKALSVQLGSCHSKTWQVVNHGMVPCSWFGIAYNCMQFCSHN